ncbi:glycosyltransferase family 2 protein [Acidovorax sp. MR-S7]|uniref:glycosyltransferase family 2 protein n=1 Tax=Acidovorax sp. MR-S7 TaxID=1268622 RepID=UPI0003A7ADF9|nr:glycosyltransferase family 2 protein [Acidovorax sp. MR-S7]GAD20283.1 glycosyltransferases involved in cell wall biogenesis [Acidovorax sp. MR-S7]
MKSTCVDLLLATYNGARHLGAQLDSLLAQTHQDFRLLVSDDGSTDGTLTLLESYRARFGGRLVLVPNAAPGRGTVRNFENLMQSSLRDAQAGWAAFCDQDDIWLPRKIEATLAEMQRLEARAGEGAACVVHSDLVVVDSALNVVHPSFVRHQRFDPANCTADALLSINQVTGCAMMVNRALLQTALPLPAAAVMHDWWCALLAGSGHRSFLDEPLVLYRQHGANQLGAKGRTLRNRLARLVADAPGVLRRVRALGQATRAQALALRERLDSLGRDGGYVEDYLAWRGRPLWRRLGGHRRYYAGPALDRCSRLLFW